MPTNANTANPADPILRPFVDFWASYMKQADAATREYFDNFDGGQEARTWQRRWFEAVSKSMDAYMRSPVFLQAMKQQTELAIKTKRQGDDLVAEAARNLNVPTATDISGLYERLHSHEHAILSQLRRIEERLKAIEQQVGLGEPVGS